MESLSAAEARLEADIAAARADMQEIHDAAGENPFTASQQSRWDDLKRHLDKKQAALKVVRDKRRADLLERAESGDPSLTLEPAEKPINVRRTVDPFDLSTIQRDNRSPQAAERDLIERARRAIGEHIEFVDDRHAEEAERKVRQVRDRHGHGYSVARHILRTSTPAYESAWMKAMSGHSELLTDQERHAVQTLEEERAASVGTDSEGGFLLPTVLDTSVIQTADISVNPWRQISRIESVVNNNGWTGVSSAGITASWDTEGSEVSDDTPTFSQPTVPVYKAAAFVPFSIELGDDWSGLAQELAREFAEAKDNLEGTAFATGSGSNQPTGIVTALTGVSGVYTAMATNSAFAVGDLFTAQEALQSRHQGNAVWVMNLVHINDVREFGGTNYYTRSVTLEADATGGRGAGRILGKPVFESSDLSSTLDGDTNNNVVYGNFRNYVIADRIGVRTEFIPHLFATGNNRPSGQRGLYMHWRVGSDSVADAGFVLLYNPST